MNKTEIDWTNLSHNPVTGCLHGCPWCYARTIARRFAPDCWRLDGNDLLMFAAHAGDRDDMHELHGRIHYTSKAGKRLAAAYPFGFDPTFHRYRLDELRNLRGKPRMIFVCDMADLFGAWVPGKWISEVTLAIAENQERRHVWQFLTKNPERYARCAHMFGLNAWLGATATTTAETERALRAFKSLRASGWQGVCYLSMEPLLQPVELGRCCERLNERPDWVISGTLTGGKNPLEDSAVAIGMLADSCRALGVPLFLKHNGMDAINPAWQHEYRRFPNVYLPAGVRGIIWDHERNEGRIET